MKIYAAESSSAKVYIALFLLFTSLLIALYYNSLDYYWVWEDLHLVRTFSLKEILSTFHNTWDLDKVETPGLRPVTVIFNHARCYLFGENLLLHKIFLILLFSLLLTLSCYIGRKYFNLRLTVLLIASSLIIFNKYSCLYILWQINGTRVLQYLLLVLSLLTALKHLDNAKTSNLIYSVTLYGLSILTREDTIAAIPILVVLPLIYVMTNKKENASYYRYASYILTIFSTTILLLLLRRYFIPQATLLQTMFASKGGVRNIFQAMIWSACPFGKLLIRSIDVSLYWLILFSALFLLSLFLFNKKYRHVQLVLVFLFCCACTPAYMIFKPDIILLPTGLFCLLLAEMIVEYSTRFKLGLYFSVTIYSAVLFLAIATNYALQQSFHPLAVEQIAREYDFLYGEYSHTTIPSYRIDYLTHKFNSLGITKDNFDYVRLNKESPKTRLFKPKAKNGIFLQKFHSYLP
jgi:hypothetical protein